MATSELELPGYIPFAWHDRIRVVTDAKGTHYLWTGWNNGEGRGKAREGGKAVYTHRRIVEIVTGRKLNRFEYVDHVAERCDHKACMNFDHLEPVPPAVNTARGPGAQHQFKPAWGYGEPLDALG